MSKKSILSVIINQAIFIVLVWWIAMHQSDVYRPVHISSQQWIENVQEVVQLPNNAPLSSWKGQKEIVQVQNKPSYVQVCLATPFQINIVSKLRMYISSNLDLVVHWRKSDLLFPFHYDW